MTLRFSHTKSQGVSECVERLLCGGHLGKAVSVFREAASEAGCRELEFAEVAVLKRWRAFLEKRGCRIVDARCSDCNKSVSRVAGIPNPCEHCGGAVVIPRVTEPVPLRCQTEFATAPAVGGSIDVMLVSAQ